MQAQRYKGRRRLLLTVLIASLACDEGNPGELDEDSGSESVSVSEAGAERNDGGVATARDAAEGVPELDAAASPRDASARDANARDTGADTRDARARDADPGSTGDAERPRGRSPGCGKAAQGAGDFSMRSVRVMDRDRIYQVRLPDGYDPSRAYPLIFRFHGSGGDGLAGGLGIEYPAEDAAIVVGPDGLGMTKGWSAGNEANDLAFFDAMYDALSQAHCVDLGRVFAYGFSMGGGMSNALSCKRASKLRGVAVIAGFDRGTGSCDSQTAAWFLHDQQDGSVPIAQGRSARDRMLTRNHCGAATVAAGESCVRYEGCDTGYPVVWCETNGNGHDIAGDSAPTKVWEFFRNLQ